MRKTEIIEFLKQYPEFDNEKSFRVVSNESHRYGGDYTINIYEYDSQSNDWQFLKSFWCKLWNTEAETTYQFEEEKFVRYNRIRVSIDDSDLIYGAHYDYDEKDYQIDYGDEKVNDIFGTTDFNRIENNVVEAWRKDNEQKVREEIARKILSGELEIRFYCSDSDSWEAPLSQIEKIYKV